MFAWHFSAESLLKLDELAISSPNVVFILAVTADSNNELLEHMSAKQHDKQMQHSGQGKPYRV